MRTKLVTCPETAHLEQIEYLDHPFGMLVVGCSRFEPTCAVRCPRTCTQLLRIRRDSEKIEKIVPASSPT